MTAKRALVVDDSKSARNFLSALLEQHALEVDSAETAEQAIDYLTRHRPDVIFMDHMMPGMDGFQAVVAIKSNPRTATIPILMYTSQEGELYVGQARALGAMGVLPKQVAPADVSKVLQQLHLTDAPVNEPVDEPEIPVAAGLGSASTPASATIIAPHTQAAMAAHAAAQAPIADVLLRDQIAELRRFLVTTLDDQSDRILDDMRTMLRHALPPPADPPPLVAPRAHRLLPWAVALMAGLIAVLLSILLWRAVVERDQVRAQLSQVLSAVGGEPPTQAADTGVVAPAAIPAVLVAPVPFGETPLGGARIEEMRNFVQAIAQQDLKGAVEVRRHAGRYCLTGNAADGYSLAVADVPYVNCDLVADADDPVLGAASPESMEFATALAQLRRQYAKSIRVDVTVGADTELARSYPEIGGNPPRVPTAGQWNSAAEANNRVELRWHPAP